MCKVLVVDDSKYMRIHISKLIKELGYEVVAEAANCHEALEMLEKYTLDIVTLDINMPIVQGYEGGVKAIKHIKELNPKIKVVMITSSSEQDNILSCIKHGASGYILKPVNLDKMKRTFTKVLYQAENQK